MNADMLSELTLPLVIALLLLSVISVTRGRSGARVVNSGTKTATSRMSVARQSGPRHLVRAFAKQGTPIATISRNARVPHDVVGLALYMEQRRVPKRRSSARA